MKTNLLAATLVFGLLTSNISIAFQNKPDGGDLHWLSSNSNDVITAMPPPEQTPQWYLRLQVNEKCGDVPCGQIRLTNCLRLFNLSAGEQGICQFADSKKPVTWYAIGSSTSAGTLKYEQWR